MREAAKSKDAKQLLAEVTGELEYALAELWYHRRVSMTSEEFDLEYKGMLQVAKEANLHLLEICSKFNKEIEMKRVIGGVEYEAVTDKYDTCEGCVGYSYDESTNDLCKKLRDDCDYKIWIKVDTEETQNKPSNAHKHAEAMKLYAEDAATTDKPWELWEYRYGPYGDEEDWRVLENNPTWAKNSCYRRKAVKPKTININGYEVPEPCRGSIGIGSKYYVADITNGSDNKVLAYFWDNFQHEEDLMKKGLVHLTQEAAQKHLEALLSFTRKE